MTEVEKPNIKPETEAPKPPPGPSEGSSGSGGGGGGSGGGSNAPNANNHHHRGRGRGGRGVGGFRGRGGFDGGFGRGGRGGRGRGGHFPPMGPSAPENEEPEPMMNNQRFPPRGGRGGPGGGRGGRGGYDRVKERLQAIQSQNLMELEPIDMAEKKFSGRSRLYIGNLSSDMNEEKIKDLVSEYGEVGQIFCNTEKNFAFLRLSSRAEAEKAKKELDGQTRQNGRPLKVRFAPHQAAIKVSNLGPWVSNELLHKAFSIFGDIERCLVHVDDRGRSKGEGFVEFERKSSALEAQRRCTEGCFFLTSSLRPVIVDIIDETEDDDGLQEKNLFKRSQEFQYEREAAPRFADEGCFEFAYGQKWKSLHEMKKQKMESLDREMKLEEDKLIAQMEYARYEHETEQLRDQLRRREANRDQQKSQWEERERQMSEMMRQEQERRNNDEASMINRIQEQDNAMRQRQQENSLFMQAQEINNLLDQQEADMNRGNNGGWGDEQPNKMNQGPPGPVNFNNPPGGNFRNQGFENYGTGGFRNNFDHNFGNRRGGGWGNDMGGPGNKRRRF